MEVFSRDTSESRTVNQRAAEQGGATKRCTIMLKWLDQNVDFLTLLANLGMLVVWMTYLHLMYVSYRRERRKRLLIHSGSTSGLDAPWMLINLSKEPVHVLCVLVVAKYADDGKRIAGSASYRTSVAVEAEGVELRDRMKQGPVGAGEMLPLGTMRHLVGSVDPSAAGNGGFRRFSEVELRVIAFAGTEDKPIGARRKCRITGDDKRECAPISPYTEQLITRKGRRTAEQWLKEI